MTDDEDLWSDEICALVDAAFETVSRNPSDHEEAVAYRRAIAAAMRQPTQSDALREALADLLHAVCGEKGFAEAVRRDSGWMYPWPALDLAEAKAIAALEQSK